MAERKSTPKPRRPDVRQVAASVLREQVAEARTHLAGALDGSDPEELHDLRVAVRRMRAALRLFEQALPSAGAALAEARAALKETGATLGRARDLDVQIDRMQGWFAATARAGDPAAKRAVALLRRDRGTARKAMREHVESGSFEGSLDAVEASAAAVQSGPARRTATRLIRRPSKRVLEAIAAARASPSDPAMFHALRIDVKRLRYALEFLEPALPFSAKPLLRQLRSAQEALGALQDATVEQAVAARLMERAQKDPPVRALLVRYKESQGLSQATQLRECLHLLDPLEVGVDRLRSRL